MSFTRRLTAGLPAVGVTVLAALAFAGAPAHAATGDAERAKLPQVMATPSSDGPSSDGPTRGQDGYYGQDDEAPDDDATTPTGSAAATPVDDETPGDTGPTRGQGGYGTISPTPTTPTATAKTVPPGVSPTTAGPRPSDTTPGGVSAGELPRTGAPTSATLGVGLLMVAAGGAAVWYTRRRRTA